MIKKVTTLCILFTVLLSSSCQQKYKNLDNGLYAEFLTTKGVMVAKLFYDRVPLTVSNFVALAEGKHPMVEEKYKGIPFYDGTVFHRVMDKFMIQGGDPTATGTGTPGYKFPDEFHPDLKHDKPGILSMANSGTNTNGSQFFITEVPTGHLDNKHTVFGEIVIGLEIQDSISNVKVAGSKPIEDVVITKINIIRKGTEARKFKADQIFETELANVEERQKQLKEEARRKAEEETKIAQDTFLKNNEALKGRKIESPTGMTMIFTYESDGEKPNNNQMVNIDCAGYLENGSIFWTTWKDVAKTNNIYDERQDKAGRYSPFSMPYNETATLVAGFKEAMLNMKIGDKARVFIPYYLGYGENGRPPVIPQKANLIFDIELTSIKE